MAEEMDTSRPVEDQPVGSPMVQPLEESQSGTSLAQQLSILSQTVVAGFRSLEDELTAMRGRLASLESLQEAQTRQSRGQPAVAVEGAVPIPVGAASATPASPVEGQVPILPSSSRPPFGTGEGAGPSVGAAGSRSAGFTVPVARDRDTPLSSFELSQAAAAWAAQKSIKLQEFPRLGRGQGELPYGRWKYFVLAITDAAFLSPILQTEFPIEGSTEVQHYYRTGNALVFQALLSSVSGIPVLSDIVLRLYGQPSSAYFSWLAVQRHFVRLSANRQTYLMRRIHELEPRQGEHMEAFLNRCAALQTEFAEYDVPLDESLLITQVLSKLSIQWRTRAGLDHPIETLTWAIVAEALQAEDNNRRQSNLQSPEALLPLGFTRRSAVSEGGARPVQVSVPTQTGGAAPARKVVAGSHAGQGSSQQGGSGPTSGPGSRTQDRGRSRSRSRTPSRSQGSRPPLVCWHCLRSGHAWEDCPTLPQDWRPTRQDRIEAERLRQERHMQSERDRALAAQSRQASKPVTPTSTRSPSPRGRSRSPAPQVHATST